MHNEWPHFGSTFFDVDASGTEITAAGDNVIIHSSDTGSNWEEINFPFKSARLKHISKVADGHFVAAGVSLYVSTNNGADWIENEDMDGILTMENFGSTIIVTRDVEEERFMRSDDGGLTWLNLSTANVTMPSALDFIDKDHAFFSGDDGMVYYNSNGGLSWDVINDTTFNTGIESLRFADINLGYAQIDNIVWQTLDGGITWVEIIDSFKAREGLYLFESGLYSYSGSSFSFYDNGSLPYIMQDDNVDEVFSFDIAEANGKLFLSGTGMVLMHDVTESLEEWSDLTPGPNDGFKLMASRGNKFVVSGGRRMQVSNSQGDEFTEVETGISNISDLEIASDGSIYETQSSLQVSVNDGEDWEFVSSSVTLVHVFEDGRIMTAGGSMLKQSTDNGVTFQDIFEYTGFPSKLYFYDANFGWLLNLSGVSYRTLDGGLNWEEVVFPFGASPSRMHFLDEQKGYAIKNLTNRFWKTVDGGTTWEELDFNEEAGLTDLYFEDEMIGYTCGRFNGSEEGVVYQTINGGDTWEIFQRGISLFWDIEYDEGTRKMWVCGQKAQLFSYSECANLKPTLSLDGDQIICNEPSESYKWYLDDVFLVETTEPILNIVSQGNYTVRIKGDEGCVSVPSDEIDAIVNVDAFFESSEVSIYPNPSQGNFTIQLLDGLAIESVEVFNLQGQSVFQNDSREYSYNLSSLNSGNYFVKIFTSEGFAIKQLSLSK